MNIAYIRVSTVGQHTDRQDVAFKERGIRIDKVFSEKVSGKNMLRPQLKEMLDFIREGDTVYVTELSRLARSTVDLYEIAEVFNRKGVKLKSLKEEIDLTSATGKLTFGILAVLAQFERDLIRERQAEGIRVARESGKKWGRKKMYGTDPRKSHDIFTRYKSRVIGEDQAIAEYGGSRATFYKAYAEWKREHPGTASDSTT